MIKQPILTIGIPSYKRVDKLEHLINLLKQETTDEFTILICDDDDATDETKNMVQKYMKQMPNLRYHKNEKNLGFNRNVLKVYELTKTRYLWYICDDETYIENAVTKIIRNLKEFRPTVAIFSCTWVDPYGVKRRAGVNENHLYTDIEQLGSYEKLVRLTFLSIDVFEKIIQPDELHIENIDDNVFIQLTIALALLNKKFRLFESKETVIHRNVGYKYGEFFKFNVIDHIKAVYSLPHSFNNQQFILISKKNVISLFLLYLSQQIGIFEYRLKRPTKETVNHMQLYYGNVYTHLFLSFIWISKLFPQSLLKIVYFMRLVSLHGFGQAKRIYDDNINRASKDSRATKFTSYQ